MNHFCFGSFFNIIKSNIIGINQDDTFFLLIDLLKKKNDKYFPDSAAISRITNQKANLPTAIMENATDTRVTYNLADKFDQNVIPSLNPISLYDLIDKMNRLITGDCTIPHQKKDELATLKSIECLPQYLADAFLYSIFRDNARELKQFSDLPIATSESVEVIIEKIDILKAKIPLNRLECPIEITADENPYVNKIFETYSEKIGITILSKNDLNDHQDYLEHFNDQRRYYHQAESINRKLRDGAKNQKEQLLLEAKDAIIETLRKDYSFKFERLEDSLKRMAEISIGNNSYYGHYFDSATKKGYCHVLVKENIIKGWDKHGK